jgi:hypothetical protein
MCAVQPPWAFVGAVEANRGEGGDTFSIGSWRERIRLGIDGTRTSTNPSSSRGVGCVRASRIATETEFRLCFVSPAFALDQTPSAPSSRAKLSVAVVEYSAFKAVSADINSVPSIIIQTATHRLIRRRPSDHRSGIRAIPEHGRRAAGLAAAPRGLVTSAAPRRMTRLLRLVRRRCG